MTPLGTTLAGEGADGISDFQNGRPSRTLPKEQPMARFELYKDPNGEYRWRFISSNGRILADSGESYRADCQSGIDLVKGESPAARVEEK